MLDFVKLAHWNGIRKRIAIFLVNCVFKGTSVKHFEIKRKLLNVAGYQVGIGTKVVGPIECTGKLIVGANCWIGKNLKVNGNGTVVIGDNCDIAPEVTFQTGGHEIGGQERRAGKGIVAKQMVGNGVWIGGRTTIIGNVKIGNSSVIAGCACVVRDVEPNSVVGGVPARIIRRLDDASTQSISE